MRTLAGPVWARYLRALVDPRVTEPLPIQCWVIEHPDGIIVVDTGELARASDPTFFDDDRDYRRVVRLAKAARFTVAPGDEIGPQLNTLGIDSHKDVRTLVLTHLHCDHADGITYFPNAEILIARTEFEHTHYAFPRTWPIWFRPKLVEYANGSIGAFATSQRIANHVFLVPTPGHTHGHQSVMVREGEGWLCLAGDATYSEDQLRDAKVGGCVADVKLARHTIEVLRRQCARYPTVYLPSHDPGAVVRLNTRKAVT